MSWTGGGRLDCQLYMFAAEDGVDTTWCRGAINSEREVARFWRLLESGMEENIRDPQSSLVMLGWRGTGDFAGRQADRQTGGQAKLLLQRNYPRAWVLVNRVD